MVSMQSFYHPVQRADQDGKLADVHNVKSALARVKNVKLHAIVDS